jgi:Rrf2 family transcriptional regulator, iron-sulfur cluster assembly transcription factor
MDLTLTKTGDYAVRAALALATSYREGRYVTISEVAERMALPKPFTPHVLAMLSRAGIVTSKTGRGGGYRLERDPRTISLLEVVESAEGPLINSRCTLRGGACRPDDRCVVHGAWTAAGEAFRERLREATLGDLVG